MSKHPTSNYFHLVLSPKECPDPQPLKDWLKSKTVNHILSLEKGTTGHEHLECFYQLQKLARADHQKRAILSLYPNISTAERKNIKVCINTIDPNPEYGFGYSLKEGNVLSTTFDEFQHADFLDYYSQNADKVSICLQKVKPESFLTIDQLAEGCVNFINDYFDGKPPGTSPVGWLITEYLKSVKSRLSFSIFQKINKEKLEEFISIKLGEVLLTPPSQILPSLLPSINNPLLNQTEEIDC